MNTFTEKSFGSAFGREARLFTVSDGDISASFTDLGAALVSLRFCGRETVLGYGSAEGYALGSSSLGATVGRYAGRIENARFTLGGREYRLPANDGPNHLHGCFAKRFFDVEASRDGLIFRLESPDGEDGFPGRLSLCVRAGLEGSSLRLAYEARTDSETVLNITNHSYFNLNGGGTVHGHRLRLFSDRFAEVREGLIPTGRLVPTSETVFDFTEERPLSGVLSSEEVKTTRGLDHSFYLPGEGLKRAAELYSPDTGVRMTVLTTQPTVHVYTAGFLDLDEAGLPVNGAPAARHGGVCLETQHFPNSPNIKEFPGTELGKGDVYSEETIFSFCQERTAT